MHETPDQDPWNLPRLSRLRRAIGEPLGVDNATRREGKPQGQGKGVWDTIRMEVCPEELREWEVLGEEVSYLIHGGRLVWGATSHEEWEIEGALEIGLEKTENMGTKRMTWISSEDHSKTGPMLYRSWISGTTSAVCRTKPSPATFLSLALWKRCRE